MRAHKLLRLAFCMLLIGTAGYVSAQEIWRPPSLPDVGGLASTAVIERGVVKVVSSWNSGDSEIGAGILLNVENGNLYILTAAHVVRQFGSADRISIQFHGDSVNRSEGEILRYDDVNDVSVLVVRGFYRDDILKSFIKYPLAPGYDYARGGLIKTIGHPGDTEWLIAPGRSVAIAAETKMGLEADVVKYGNSGGPVLTNDNRVIGMVTDVEGQEIAYAVRMDFILRKLKEWNVPIRARFVGDVADHLASITNRTWDTDWESLKGVRMHYEKYERDHYGIWQARESLLEAGDARIVEWLGKVAYIERLGEYAADASLDEAWRIWLNELNSCLPAGPDKKQQAWQVYEPGRYQIRFEKYQGFAWPSSRKVTIEVREYADALYVLIYNFEHPFTYPINPQGVFGKTP